MKNRTNMLSVYGLIDSYDQIISGKKGIAIPGYRKRSIVMLLIIVTASLISLYVFSKAGNMKALRIASVISLCSLILYVAFCIRLFDELDHKDLSGKGSYDQQMRKQQDYEIHELMKLLSSYGINWRSHEVMDLLVDEIERDRESRLTFGKIGKIISAPIPAIIIPVTLMVIETWVSRQGTLDQLLTFVILLACLSTVIAAAVYLMFELYDEIKSYLSRKHDKVLKNICILRIFYSIEGGDKTYVEQKRTQRKRKGSIQSK